MQTQEVIVDATEIYPMINDNPLTDYKERMEGLIRKRPLASLAIALGAGALVMGLGIRVLKKFGPL